MRCTRGAAFQAKKRKPWRQKGRSHDPAICADGDTPMARVSVGLETHADPSAQTKALAFPVTRTRRIHRTEIQPIDDEDDAGSPVPGRSGQWERCRTFGYPTIDMRRDTQRHARPRRATDKDSADNREGLAPTFGRHADLGEPKRRVAACDRGGYGEEERDCGADERRPHRRKGDLPDRQGRAAGENADNKRADDARAAVEGGQSRRQAREEREHVDREREQQPAEEANAGNAQNKSGDEHGGDPRDKGSNGRAFHHHHGAL
jgi:hypothetical protein